MSHLSLPEESKTFPQDYLNFLTISLAMELEQCSLAQARSIAQNWLQHRTQIEPDQQPCQGDRTQPRHGELEQPNDRLDNLLDNLLESIAPAQPASASDCMNSATEIDRHCATLLESYPEKWQGWLAPHHALENIAENIEHSLPSTPTDLANIQLRTAELAAAHQDTLMQANPLHVCLFQTSAGHFIFDGRERRLLKVNAIAYDILEQALQGKSLQQLIRHSPGDISAYIQEIAKLILSGLLTLNEATHQSVPSIPSYIPWCFEI